MKWLKLSKPAQFLVLALLLTAMLVAPAAAQEPEGDVEAQLVGFFNFLWNPINTFVSRGDGTVVTKLNVEGAEDISGLTLAIAYDSSIVTPEDVQPGALLPGTRGVDYFMTVNPGGGGLICGDSSFTVNIVYLDPTVIINGSGSLVEITWRSDPAALVGEVADVCLDGVASEATDNGGLSLDLVDTFGTIEVEPNSIFKFQIGLEGGENSGDTYFFTVPHPIFTDVKINGLYPCDGGQVDANGFCAFNNGMVGPPYDVEVSRFGYLDVEATFDAPHDSSSVFLLAGDLNDDNAVNILDLVLMASVLNQPVAGTNSLLWAADYTGPNLGAGPTPDGVVNIIDMVLMAKNYGTGGPTDGTPPGGTFPF
ncbi:MAG: hypothetical protein DPW09_35820 [Anaerolineae bacterium]|nr:hypothetical protein [Anaerolineales bacterium]MCQ3978823.1 hypothetical protein [Anaerolineae bacterium]